VSASCGALPSRSVLLLGIGSAGYIGKVTVGAMSSLIASTTSAPALYSCGVVHANVGQKRLNCNIYVILSIFLTDRSRIFDATFGVVHTNVGQKLLNRNILSNF
jgi:hypothetical protein